MLSKIIDLENTFNSLLPERRLKELKERPSAELLDAASAWAEMVWETGKNLGPLSLTPGEHEDGLRLSKKPIFICGVHRSGTTLMRDLLDNHPTTVLPAEGSFLTNHEPRMRQIPTEDHPAFMAKEWLRRIANPINQSPYWLLGRSSNERSPYVLFVRYFLAWWAVKGNLKTSFSPLLSVVLAYSSVRNETGKNHWVDKTPTNEQFIKKIWKEIPDARIVHIIRDPVNVFISLKRMQPQLNLRAFIRDLKMSYKIAIELSGSNDKRYVLLRYENLCENPESVTGYLAEVLGIEKTPELLYPSVAGKPSTANSSFKNTSDEGRILNADEHSHDELLTPTEYELLTVHIGALATKLGYPMPHFNILRTQFLKLKHFL